jgi:hypothetical protein
MLYHVISPHATCHAPRDTWHVTRDTWHVTLDTWHMTCDTWHMKPDIWHVTLDTWHVSRDTRHVTRDTWHVTRDTWHVTRDTSHVPRAVRHCLLLFRGHISILQGCILVPGIHGLPKVSLGPPMATIPYNFTPCGQPPPKRPYIRFIRRSACGPLTTPLDTPCRTCLASGRISILKIDFFFCCSGEFPFRRQRANHLLWRLFQSSVYARKHAL